jgi:alpha-glucosidase
VANPVSRYRFLVEGRGGSRWLTQHGHEAVDLPDTWDFALVADEHPAPSWVPDAFLYQIFPDRFARAGTSDAWPDWAMRAAWDDPVATNGPGRMRQLYGGDLDGVVARLDHLASLGVTGLYLTPFFPAQENHRYCATAFDTVDPCSVATRGSRG